MFKNVIMVCIGNICRGPIAEVYLKHHQPKLKVYSFGLGALSGKSADPFFADLILTMEQWQLDTIQNKFPEPRSKVHLIGKLTDNQEIPGTYKKDREVFESASVMIESGLDAWRNKLWKLN